MGEQTGPRSRRRPAAMMPRWVLVGVVLSVGGILLMLAALALRGLLGFSPIWAVIGTLGVLALLAALIMAAVSGYRTRREERRDG